MWEVNKVSRFLSTEHGILPSCGSKARETVVAKCELVLWRISPVDLIRLIGPLKPHGKIFRKKMLENFRANVLKSLSQQFLARLAPGRPLLSSPSSAARGKSTSYEVTSVSDVRNGQSNRPGKIYCKGLLENLMSGLQVIPVIPCYTCYERN